MFRGAESPPLGPESPPWACGTKVPPRTSGSVPFDTRGLASWLNCGGAGDSALVGPETPPLPSKAPPTSFGGVPPHFWNHPGEWSFWWGWSLRTGITQVAGVSAAPGTQVFLPKYPGNIRPMPVCLHTQSQVRSTGVSALESPIGPETPPQTDM